MTDISQIIHRLENELKETKQELNMKERQIETMKQTNKIQEVHAEHQRKRILALEAQRSPAHQDGSKTQQVAAKIDHLNEELRKLNATNMKISSQNEDLKKKVYELQSKVERQTKNLEQSYQVQRSRLLKEAENTQKRITNLENQLSKAKKKIREWEENVKNSKKLTTSQPIQAFINQLTKVQDQQVCRNLTSNHSSKNHRYQDALLSESLDENHVQIPQTHKGFFKLFNIYLESLVPQERIKLLNTVSADTEFKLDSINEEFSAMEF